MMILDGAVADVSRREKEADRTAYFNWTLGLPEDSKLFKVIETEEKPALFVDLFRLLGKELAMWTRDDFGPGRCLLCNRRTEKLGTVIMDPANAGMLAVKKKGSKSLLEQNAHELGVTCMRRANKALAQYGLELQ